MQHPMCETHYSEVITQHLECLAEIPHIAPGEENRVIVNLDGTREKWRIFAILISLLVQSNHI